MKSVALLWTVRRGVTYLNGEGAYTGEEIFTVNRLEESKLKLIVTELDEMHF